MQSVSAVFNSSLVVNVRWSKCNSQVYENQMHDTFWMYHHKQVFLMFNYIDSPNLGPPIYQPIFGVDTCQ